MVEPRCRPSSARRYLVAARRIATPLRRARLADGIPLVHGVAGGSARNEIPLASRMLADEPSEVADKVREQLDSTTGFIPPVFRHEARGLLLKAERRGRCSTGEAEALVRQLREMPFKGTDPQTGTSVSVPARAEAPSAYEAVHLALAMARDPPSATADRRLADGARRESVPPPGPFSGAAGPAP